MRGDMEDPVEKPDSTEIVGRVNMKGGLNEQGPWRLQSIFVTLLILVVTVTVTIAVLVLILHEVFKVA